MIKPIWFGLSWGIHPDLILTYTNFDFLNLVINPPLFQNLSLDPKTLKAQSSFHISLTLECIWNIRNQVFHNDTKVNIIAEVKKIELRILEHFEVLQPAGCSVAPAVSIWHAPPLNVVKLNVDAAISSTEAAPAVVARNSAGSILQCWSKIIPIPDPCIAEASNLLWAHDIAQGENFHDIIVEGDAKVCIDSIMGTAGVVRWKLQSLVANVEEVALSYNSCSFLWVVEPQIHWYTHLPNLLVRKLLVFILTI